MPDYRILPKVHIDRPDPVAMQIGGRLFSECPNCSNVLSVPTEVTLPIEIKCRCGQTYNVVLTTGG